jgi:hypothetical protein
MNLSNITVNRVGYFDRSSIHSNGIYYTATGATYINGTQPSYRIEWARPQEWTVSVYEDPKITRLNRFTKLLERITVI